LGESNQTQNKNNIAINEIVALKKTKNKEKF
jgi:hypothetical protein